MSLQTEIQQAAKRLEELINLCPNQLDVSINAIEVTQLQDIHSRKLFNIKIVSTHPVQIYP